MRNIPRIKSALIKHIYLHCCYYPAILPTRLYILEITSLRYRLSETSTNRWMHGWRFCSINQDNGIKYRQLRGVVGRGRRLAASPYFCMKRPSMSLSIDVWYSRVSGVPHFVTSPPTSVLGLHPWSAYTYTMYTMYISPTLLHSLNRVGRGAENPICNLSYS